MVYPRLKKFVLTFLAFVSVLMFAPAIPPYEVKFESVPFTPNAPFVAGLAANDRLDRAEILTTDVDGSNLGRMQGPEAFAFRDGYLYTGIAGGDIVRLDLNKDVVVGKGGGQQWQTVAKLSMDCDGDAGNCGHPLGMAFDRWGFLLVCDPFFGLVRVDVESGKSQVIIPHTQVIDGKRNAFTNSVAISSKKGGGNVVYLTSSSSRFGWSDMAYEFFTSGSGRLLKHDMGSNETQVLVDGLSFANGLVLSPEEDYILFCESGRGKVWKYRLEGPKAGTKELFAKLPGGVDNIKPNGKDGFLVGISLVEHPDDKLMIVKRIMSCAPLTRLLVRIVWSSHLLLEFLSAVVPEGIKALVVEQLANMEQGNYSIVRKYGLVVELNAKGDVTQSWHSPGGDVAHISDAFLHTDGYIYLGSPANRFAARVLYE